MHLSHVTRHNANVSDPQAANEIENLKMSDSPIKKINLEPVGKENIADPTATITPTVQPKDALVEPVKTVKTLEKPVAPMSGLRPEEADEPILKENPHRFVLFPIKYHEVGIPNP